MSEDNKTIDITDAEIISVDEDKEGKEKKVKKESFLKRLFSSKLAVAITATAAVILIILVIILTIMHFSSSKGSRLASDLSDYLGEKTRTAEQELDISLKEESDYSGINKAVKFDRIYESDETVQAAGVTYPKWAIFINVDTDTDEIVTVRYADLTVIEKDLNGFERKGGEVNLDRFDKDDSFGTISDEINVEPYSVTYTIWGKRYVYKYWYTTENNDRQAVLLRVDFNKKNKFLEYKSELLYPENL